MFGAAIRGVASRSAIEDEDPGGREQPGAMQVCTISPQARMSTAWPVGLGVMA